MNESWPNNHGSESLKLVYRIIDILFSFNNLVPIARVLDKENNYVHRVCIFFHAQATVETKFTRLMTIILLWVLWLYHFTYISLSIFVQHRLLFDSFHILIGIDFILQIRFENKILLNKIKPWDMLLDRHI